FDAGMALFPAADATPDVKAAAIAFVMSAQPGHGTCAKRAILTALDMAGSSTVARKMVVYESDGQQACNAQDPVQTGKDVLDAVKAANTNGIPVDAICIGPNGGVEEDWMKALAAQNGGEFVRVITTVR